MNIIICGAGKVGFSISKQLSAQGHAVTVIDQKFKRINGTKYINTNIRIISSSSKNLKDLISKGNFREDLYHRLNVVPIELPPLTSRTEDIPLLINYFKEKLADLNGVPEALIDSSNDNLYTYDWPGNIRELRNLVERVTILSLNENKENINKILNDILSKSSLNKNNTDLKKSYIIEF